MAEMQNTTLASRRLVGVEFEQVSNLPEKKNIQKYIKFCAWSNNVNFDPNATCFLKCSVLVPLRRYFKIWLPVNQHYRRIPKHNLLAREDKRALSSFGQLVLYVNSINYDGDTLSVRGC